MAVPVSIGIALFISHYAPRRLASGLGYVIDLLAAVPSVVFGLWGANVLAPAVLPLYTWLTENLGWIPFFAPPASGTGRTILTAAIVLAVMVLPIITALSREVFLQTPVLHEEAALALGATRWEMIRTAVLPFGQAGHHQRLDARTRSRTRGDDGGRHGALRLRRHHLRPAHLVQPRHDRRQHRPAVPRGFRAQHQPAHRDRADPLRDHARREHDRALDHQSPQGILGGELMSQTTTTNGVGTMPNAFSAGLLGKRVPLYVLIACLALTSVAFLLFGLAGDGGFNIVGVVLVTALLYMAAIYVTSLLIEGNRKATDRLITALVVSAFVVALLPLISLVFTVITNGTARFDVEFFTYSMRNIVGEGGGIVHAIVGTLLMTLTAAVISVPIGLLASIYLVEYGRGPLARAITFFVDVMTGIPSIVAGLFAYSVFAIFFGPGIKLGIAGAIALSVLMIPSWSARVRTCSSWYPTSCVKPPTPSACRSGSP
jgi:ABC-type phosphate transport system permease subunit